MYGTTNAQVFLQEDVSGYRRYIAINPTEKLNFEAFKEQLPQLWAEAAVLYHQGARYWQIEHKPSIDEHVATDPMHERVHDFLVEFTAEKNSRHRVSVKGRPHWEFKPVDICDYVGISQNSPKAHMELANWLIHYGGEKKSNGIGQRGVRVWRFREDILFNNLGK
jgi:hypothetical protein